MDREAFAVHHVLWISETYLERIQIDDYKEPNFYLNVEIRVNNNIRPRISIPLQITDEQFDAVRKGTKRCIGKLETPELYEISEQAAKWCREHLPNRI